MGGLRGGTWRLISEFATKRSSGQDEQVDKDDREGTPKGDRGSRSAEETATRSHVGPRGKFGGGVAAPSHRGDDASRAGSGAAKNPDHRQGPEEAEAAAGEGGARPRPVTAEGVPAAATKATPKPTKARKGRVAEKAAGAGKRVPEMAKVGGKTGTTVSQPELSPDEEKARVERMVAERNARARQQAVREKRVAAMTIRPGEAPRVQRPTEGEQGRTRPNQTVREEDGEEEEKRETTPEPPRQGRKRRPTVTLAELESGAMESEVAEVEKVMARKEVNGTTYYLVKWMAADERGEPEMDWVTREEADEDQSPGLRLQVTELYGLEYRWTVEHIRAFENRGRINRVAQKGLSKGQINECLDYAVTQGWNCRVEKNMLGPGGVGKGGLASVIEDTGVYLIGTMDYLGRGHCAVVEVTPPPFPMYMLYEGGIKMPLGDYKYADQVLFVRKCEPAASEGTVEPDEGGGGENEAKAYPTMKTALARRTRRRRFQKAKPMAASPAAPTVDLTNGLDSEGDEEA
ncbi:unnamed protein product [Peronospora effusa]|nr:unnamed protein product [Peronospora effusa]